MSSRAAILPTPGDPFLLNYWLAHFNKYWADEVDALYIYLNTPAERYVADYIIHQATRNPKVRVIYNPNQIDHGLAIDKALDEVGEDYVVLLEDDCLIFKSGEIDHCFRLLECGDYDVVGSKRGSCHMEILQEAKRLWGLNYEGEGDQGPNFWPNLLFTKKETLLKTDRNFCGKAWKKGMPIHELNGYVVKDETACSDTFVSASLQLRMLGLRFYYIPQYHGSPDDLRHQEQHKYLFDGLAPWVHVGSLSSGVSGVLTDGAGRPLNFIPVYAPKPDGWTLPNFCHTEGEKLEWERRVQMWLRAGQFAEGDLGPKMNEFHDMYMAAIDRLIAQNALNRKNITRRISAYHGLGML